MFFLAGQSTPDLVRQIRSVKKVVSELLHVLEKTPCMDGDAPRKKKQASVAKNKRGKCNQLNVGLAFLAKCLRDVPRLPEVLRSTSHERASFCERLHQLLSEITGYACRSRQGDSDSKT